MRVVPSNKSLADSKRVPDDQLYVDTKVQYVRSAKGRIVESYFRSKNRNEMIEEKILLQFD